MGSVGKSSGNVSETFLDLNRFHVWAKRDLLSLKIRTSLIPVHRHPQPIPPFHPPKNTIQPNPAICRVALTITHTRVCTFRLTKVCIKTLVTQTNPPPPPQSHSYIFDFLQTIEISVCNSSSSGLSPAASAQVPLVLYIVQTKKKQTKYPSGK